LDSDFRSVGRSASFEGLREREREREKEREREDFRSVGPGADRSRESASSIGAGAGFLVGRSKGIGFPVDGGGHDVLIAFFC
jgi:hypothetical protein